MPVGFGLDLKIDLNQLSQAEKTLEKMVASSAQLRTNMSNALSNFNTGEINNILQRLQSSFTNLNNTKITPNFDTSKAENLYGVMDKIVAMMQSLSRQQGVSLFNTQNVYAANDSIFDLEAKLAKVKTSIKDLKDEWEKLNKDTLEAYKKANPFQAPINPTTNRPYGKNTQVYKQALQDYEDLAKQQHTLWANSYNYWLDLQMKQLNEEKKILSESLKYANKTQDEKAAYVQKSLENLTKAERNEIKQAEREYAATLKEMSKLMKSTDKMSKNNADGSLDLQILGQMERFDELNKRKEALELQYGQFIVDTAKKYNAEVLNIYANRINDEKRLKAKQEEEQRKTVSGALAFSNSAQSINDEKKAIEYLVAARNDLSKSSANYKSTLKQLNDAIQKHRISVEQLTTAEKNEKTLQPTIRNEYLRLLQEIDKVRKAREDLAKTDAFKRGTASALQANSDLVSREQDLQNRITQIRKNAANLLDEVDREHAAKRAQAELAEIQKVEAQKNAIARKKLQERLSEYKRSGAVSSEFATRLISYTDNAKNIAQEEKAIRSLKNARQRLNKEDANYQSTLDKLNAKIAEHEHNIKMATDATYREADAKRRAASANTTYDGAMNFSKNAKSIEEQRKAIEYLKQARDKLDKSTMGATEYEKKLKRINEEIRRQQKEVDRLTAKQQMLKSAHRGLMDTMGQLQRKIALVFSVSSIQNYINKMISVRKEFELQQKALESILSNKDEADRLWQQTIDLALKSPFRIKELITYTKQLAAYRIETDKLHQTTRMLADVSAGLGVDMNRLILAYGQVRAAEYLRGTELRQFTEAGIPLLDELAKHFSKLEGRAISTADVFEMISKRMVAFKDVTAVFEKITSEGGIFYQMQEKQSETLYGLISNLQDSIDLMFNDIGKANDSSLKNVLKTIKDLVEQWEDAADVVKMYSGALKLLIGYMVATRLATSKLGVAMTTLFNHTKLGFSASVRLGQAMAQIERKSAALAFVLRGVGTALRGLVMGAVLGGIVALIGWFVKWRMEATKLEREAARLKEALNGIFSEDTANLNKAIDGYNNLITRLSLANKHSLERKNIIDKINENYGEYIDFVVDENTTIEQLTNSYDELVKRMKEKQAFATFEKGLSEINDSYGKSLKDAKDSFYELFEGASIKSSKNNLKFIVPTKKEIDDIYALVQQKTRDLNKDEMDDLQEQHEIIHKIVSEYYGQEFFLSKDFGQSIELMDILVSKKQKELELQKEIDAQYKEVLSSREAQIALEKLKLEYAEKRRTIEQTSKTEFEKDTKLVQLAEDEQVAIIDLKVKYNIISEAKGEELKDRIINWITEQNKSINDAIYLDVAHIDPVQLDKIDKDLKKLGDDMVDNFKGNVDLLNREIIDAAKLVEKGWEDVGDGIATVFSSSYGVTDDKGNVVEILVTPILPDGTVLSQNELESYIDNTLQGAKDVLEADTKGIVIAVNVDETAGERLHLLQEEYYNLLQQRRELFSEFSEEELSKVLIDKELQTAKSAGNYLKMIEDEYKKTVTIIQEAINFDAAGIVYDEEQLKKADRMQQLIVKTAKAIGLEINHIERLDAATMKAINDSLPSEHQLKLKDAYKGVDGIIADLNKKMNEQVHLFELINERKKNGLPYDQKELDIIVEKYKWTKLIADLLDPKATTPIQEDWGKYINDKLDDKYDLTSIDLGKDEVKLLQEANSEREKAVAYQKQLSQAKEQGAPITQEQLDAAAKDVEQLTLKAQLLGWINEENKKDRTNSLYDERIKVIDDMNKKYKELHQTFDATESMKGAFDAYKDAFAKAFEGVSFVPKNTDKMSAEEFASKVLNFPDEDALVEFLDTLANEPMKAFEKIKVELAKGKYVYEIKAKTKIEQDKETLEQIEDMFGDYEVSLELQKLNIPPKMAKDLFNVDALELPDLRAQALEKFKLGDLVDLTDEEILSSKAYEKLGEKMQAEVKETLGKISEMEDKQQLERLKKYTQYLVKAQSERVKIKLEELSQLEEIENTFQLKENVATSKLFGMSNQEWRAYEGLVKSKQDVNKETLKSIGLSDELIAKIIEYNEQMKLSQEIAKSGVKRETQEKLNKAELNAFKSTSAYEMLFSDTEHYSKQTLKIIEDGLKKIRSNVKNLGISELKELREFEDKFFDVKIKQDPFKELKTSLEAVQKLKKQGITPDGEALKIQELEESNEKIQHTIDLISIVREKGAEGLLTVDEEDLAEYTDLLNKQPEILTKIIQAKQKDIKNNQEQIDTAKDNINTYNNASKAATEAFAKAQNTVSQMQNAYESLSKALVAVGVNMEESDNAVQNIGFGLLDLAMQFATIAVQAQIMGVAINTAMGPIGWAAMALSAVATIFSGIFGAYDKKKEKQIQREIELVEKLEHQYEKLEKRIDAAYSINTLESANRAAEANLRSQIAARERMIKAEQDKKDTDQGRIQDWRYEIEDLYEQIRELEQSRIQALGGFGGAEAYKSASQEFVDAWIEAYRETGDGLKGLEESFDEFFIDMVKKQIAMQGADRFLDPLYKKFDQMFDENSDMGGNVTKAELDSVKSMWNETAPELDAFIKGLIESLGIAGDLAGNVGELSGLQKGIQGITETQADIIAAYLNSIRFIISENTNYLRVIADSYSNTDIENPMVSQLRIIAQQTTAINTLLNSLVKGNHSLGGVGLKVFIS